MSPSKSSNQLLLEKFFGIKFEFAPEFPAQKDAQFFDGAVFWDVWFHEEDHLLFFIAGTQDNPISSSILEIRIFYSELKASPIEGMGEALVISPQPSGVGISGMQLTKTPEGRFSLATSLGSPTESVRL